jgi:hypothetical protein
MYFREKRTPLAQAPAATDLDGLVRMTNEVAPAGQIEGKFLWATTWDTAGLI